jgi:hypothetical protein
VLHVVIFQKTELFIATAARKTLKGIVFNGVNTVALYALFI